MPKRKVKSESGEDALSENRQRSRTVLEVFKTKLRHNRSGSVETEREKVPTKAKCATLPARVSTLEKERDRNKPRTLFWMEGLLDTLDDTVNRTTVTRKGSDESVDSGFDQVPKMEGSESDSNSSPSLSKALVPQAGGYATARIQHPLPVEFTYDPETVERAFGPCMKDICRWYSTYSTRQQLERGRLASPPRPDRPDELDIDEDERLTSRPLPPIPCDPSFPPTPPPRRRPALDSKLVAEDQIYENEADNGVYEQVQHRLMGTNGLLLGLRNLAMHGWYWGPITRVEAEEKLQGMDDGTFLVRDSSDERYLLSLSFRSQGKTLHTRVEYCNGHFSFYSFPDSESEGYTSVVELIERSMEYSRDGVFCFSRARILGSPSVPVRLLKPLSRFNHVCSLQHYCRFVIRQSIRFDRIRQLPLPRHVHGFLEQSQF